VFGFLIFVHEFGHYFFARLFKVTITEFSIGMGPRLFSRTSKKTGIKYSLAALPIGGFVSMVGENSAEPGTPEYEAWRSDPNTFDKKPAWQRFIITLAGAFVNVLTGFFAVAILSFFVTVGSTTVTKVYTPDEMIDMGYEFDTSVEGDEIEVGDKIIAIDGKKVDIFDELSYEIMRRGVEPVDVEVIRDGKELTLKNVSFATVTESGETFGMRYFDLAEAEGGVGTTLKYAWNKSVLIVRMCWESIIDLVRGRYSIGAVSGPVGISKAIGEATRSGATNLLYIIALISINLGIMNLIPFPALDGGRLLTVTLEMITRRRIPMRVESMINFVGLVILLGFSAFILVKDVVQLII